MTRFLLNWFFTLCVVAGVLLSVQIGLRTWKNIRQLDAEVAAYQSDWQVRAMITQQRLIYQQLETQEKNRRDPKS